MTETYPEDMRIAHWTVVILVFFQYLTGPIMARAFEDGLGVAVRGTGTAIFHAGLGLGILGVMLWRLRARKALAIPEPPRTEPPIIRLVSRGVHKAFYVFLIAMPIVGLLALTTGWGVLGWLHGLAARILWLLILAHIAGATLHWIQGDGVMRRMTGHGV